MKRSEKLKKLEKFLDSTELELTKGSREKFKILSEKVTLRCKKCGHIFKRQASQMIRLKFGDCPECKRKGMMLTHEEFLKKFKSMWGDQFYLLGVYKGWKEKITFLCKNCATQFESTPGSILIDNKEHQKCPHCKKRRKLSTKELREKILDITDGELVLVKAGKDQTHNSTLSCSKCGGIFERSPNSIFRYKATTCPLCNRKGSHRKSEEFRKEFEELAKDEGRFELLSEYKGTSKNVKLKDNKLNKVYYQKAKYIIRRLRHGV